MVANGGVGDGWRRGGGDKGAGGRRWRRPFGGRGEPCMETGRRGMDGDNGVWGTSVCGDRGKGVDQRWMKTSEGERDK